MLFRAWSLYGHLHDLFRVERYAHFGIVPHAIEFDPRKPQVAALLANWIDQLAELFPSPFFHAGMDETREAPALADILTKEKLPKGLSGNNVQPAALYLIQFQRVVELLKQHHKTPMFWDDMFSQYPDIISKIPPDTILVPWGLRPYCL